MLSHQDINIWYRETGFRGFDFRVTDFRDTGFRGHWLSGHAGLDAMVCGLGGIGTEEDGIGVKG